MRKREARRRKVAPNIHRTEAGTYEVKVSVRGRQIKRTVKTFREAVELRRRLDLRRTLEEAKAQPEAGPAGITLGEFLHEVWMPAHLGTGRMRPATEQQYRDLAKWLDRDAPGLPGGLQAVEVAAIGRKEITAFVRMFAGRVKSSTAGKHLKNAMRVLRSAQDEGLLQTVPSSAGLLRKPHRSVRESWVWRKEEVREALSLVRALSDERGLWDGHPVLLALLLFAASGARKSEVFGLCWSDVELPGSGGLTSSLSIRRQVRWQGRSWHLEDLKTESARRRIEIVHPALIEVLRRHRTSASLSKEGFILTRISPRRGPVPYGAKDCPITKRIRKAAAALGIRKDPETKVEKAAGRGRPKSLHGIRRYFASQLLENGEDPVYVSRLLGHSSPAITYATYAWALRTSRPESAMQLQSGLLEGLDLVEREEGEE